MANIPGAANATPGVIVEVETITTGANIPGGTRLAVIMGEGLRQETIVAFANGGGNDGLDSTYTSATGSDGRHFLLGSPPVVENRTQLFRNGIPLAVLEGAITDTFDGRYGALVDPDSGEIELQTAVLVDQGGDFYAPAGSNVGTGTIEDLELVDLNAPTENWTIRCISTRKDGYGDPIDGYGIFTARGSVSGTILDGYGNVITWQSNGVVVSNGILSFSLDEGLTVFNQGDSFSVQVQGGALLKGDSLTARYIAVTDINDAEFFTDMVSLTTKHGSPSATNRLSLAAQLAFANGAPGVFTIQTKPALPRRISYTLRSDSNGEDDIEDLTFALPLGIIPDVDANINFFVTDPITETETQIVPNKTAFYDSTITASPALFCFGAGYVYSYTVVLEAAVEKSGTDGVITVLTGTTGTLSSATVEFDSDDLSATRSVAIFNAAASGNNGTFTILSVASGVVTLSNPSGFTAADEIEFQVLDSSESSARVLFTDDLALSLGETLRATVVNTTDADFFDAGWLEAYEEAEKIDVDMVVPVPSQTISAIFQNGKVHVETQSSLRNKHERLLFIGAITGLTPENVLGTEDAAVEDLGVLEGIQGDDVLEVLDGDVEDLANYDVQDAFGDTFRVVYTFPDSIVVQAGADRLTVDGFFQASAAAGYFSGNGAIQVPLTNKVLSGFTILRSKLYAPLTLENLCAHGITVLQPVIGGGRVIWGKTTTDSGFVEEEEISIVFIRDRLAKSLRVAFAGFIGIAETPTFQSELYARGTAAMQGFKAQRLITAYKNLQVKRDDVLPTQWNVSVLAQPTYPVNFIYVKVGIGTI